MRFSPELKNQQTPNTCTPPIPLAEGARIAGDVIIATGAIALAGVTLANTAFAPRRESRATRLRRRAAEARDQITDAVEDIASANRPGTRTLAQGYVDRSDQHTAYTAAVAERVLDRSPTTSLSPPNGQASKQYDPLEKWGGVHRKRKLGPDAQGNPHTPNHRWNDPHGADSNSPATLREEFTERHVARTNRDRNDAMSKVVTPFIAHYEHMFPAGTDFRDVDALQAVMVEGRWRNSDVAKFWRAHRRYCDSLAGAQERENHLRELAGEQPRHDITTIPRRPGNPNNTASRIIHAPQALLHNRSNGSPARVIWGIVRRPKRGM